MPRKSQSTGSCSFCGREMVKGSMARHLASCNKRQEAVQAADEGEGTGQQILHLQVGDAYSPDFWLHLEVNGSATLKQLDSYLRAIWLECCGHLSRFSVGGWSGDDIPMSRKIEEIFSPGVVLTHIYDFGSSSETLLKVVNIRQGKPLTRYPIFLMARNEKPEALCAECGEPATYYCPYCLAENDEMSALCDLHMAGHLLHEYGEPLPLVNSPRVGICGYDGPAEPPY